jgi:predicted amidophosphoribosyltransferase
LSKGDWCIITTPKRRHLVKNFATRISEEIAAHLNIPFYEDVCSCRTKQRVDAIFDVNVVPKEQNVICFDDFVTTGQTLQAMKRALEPFNKNLLFFSGINNKL